MCVCGGISTHTFYTIASLVCVRWVCVCFACSPSTHELVRVCVLVVFFCVHALHECRCARVCVGSGVFMRTYFTHSFRSFALA